MSAGEGEAVVTRLTLRNAACFVFANWMRKWLSMLLH
jgi:hypothetical protein